MKIPGTRSLCVFALLAATGCAAEKSSNPLTPTVAGPIPGVDISAPKILTPAATKIPVDQQPVTLLAENASSSGVRPLTYLFEVATDRLCQQSIHPRGVTPGEGGRTICGCRIVSPRAHITGAPAQDGANTGPSPHGAFDVHPDRHQPAAARFAGHQPVRPTVRPKFVFGTPRGRADRGDQPCHRSRGQRLPPTARCLIARTAGQCRSTRVGFRFQQGPVLARARSTHDNQWPVVGDPIVPDGPAAGRAASKRQWWCGGGNWEIADCR